MHWKKQSILEDLLHYQLDCTSDDNEKQNEHRIYCILKEVYNVCEKKIPKRNAFYIVGEPSSGIFFS